MPTSVPTSDPELIKIVVPDAGPLNTFAAAGMLHLLLAPENCRLVLVDEIEREIVSRETELATFITDNKARIDVVETATGRGAEALRALGQTPGRNVGELAIVEFVMYQVDEVLGNSPALVIYEDKKLPRLHLVQDAFAKRAHIITTAAYLRKLATDGIIDDFSATWATIVRANESQTKNLHRVPSPEERELPATAGSRIRFKRP